MNSILLPPARRSTRAELITAERHQTEVIARLHSMGAGHVADLLERCQQARRDRQPGLWPWRCGSAGCWACRRTTVRRWWRGFLGWLSGPDTSLVTIPITNTADVLATTRRLRKGLRDVRDRAARSDPAWAGVAMAGMLTGDAMLIVVQHAGIARDALWTMLEQRWPQMVVSAVGTVNPCSELSVEQTVQLAIQRRGIEPVRMVIPAQRRAHKRDEAWDEPMPILV